MNEAGRKVEICTYLGASLYCSICMSGSYSELIKKKILGKVPLFKLICMLNNTIRKKSN